MLNECHNINQAERAYNNNTRGISKQLKIKTGICRVYFSIIM